MGTQDINEAQTNDSEVDAKDLTRKQIFLYSLLIGITITIAIISMIGINLFVLLIIIGVIVIYVFLDEEIRKEEKSDFLNTNSESRNNREN
ncbi:MAG: hypothetical protein ACFFAO_16455 [Candidatus Hermodarchaeota archaeon]